MICCWFFDNIFFNSSWHKCLFIIRIAFKYKKCTFMWECLLLGSSTIAIDSFGLTSQEILSIDIILWNCIIIVPGMKFNNIIVLTHLKQYCGERQFNRDSRNVNIKYQGSFSKGCFTTTQYNHTCQVIT